jgi:hypothetical protein
MGDAKARSDCWRCTMGSPQIETTPGRAVAFAAAVIRPADRDTACEITARPASPVNPGRAAGTAADGCDAMPVIADDCAADVAG